MRSEAVPHEILVHARARAAARRARDWAEADRLRAEIESAGWTVVDRGTEFSVRRARPPDLEIDGVVRYGSSGAVPSRLDEAPSAPASVVIVASAGGAAEVVRAVRAVLGGGPDGVQAIVVADGEDPAADALAVELGASPRAGTETIERTATAEAIELVRTNGRFGPAAARNAGIRRARGAVVVLMDPAVEPLGDVISPLAAALADPSVAVAGPVGLVSPDLRRFEEADPARDDVEAIDGALVAFRRADYAARGPLDEGFGGSAMLDAWWSLVLRDADDAPPRVARQVRGVPIARPGRLPGAEAHARDREAKRDLYRFLKRFAVRRDLLTRA